MKMFPQITYDEYMYKRSIAQMQFMAADSTHAKYLGPDDKKMMEDYKEAGIEDIITEAQLQINSWKETNN